MPAVLERQPDVLEGRALVDRRRVVVDHTVDRNHGPGRCSTRRVGNVLLATAGNGGNVLDGEGQVGVAGPLDADPIGVVHAGGQFVAGLVPIRSVVQCADVEIEVLERLGVRLGQLGHRGRRPAQHAPLGVANPLLQVHRLAVEAPVSLHAIGRDTREFIDVVTATQPDVRPASTSSAAGRCSLQVSNCTSSADSMIAPVDAAVAKRNVRVPAGITAGANRRDDHLLGNVERLDQQVLARPGWTWSSRH